jgi:antitoxin component of MazEF toxin-antitoxin module
LVVGVLKKSGGSLLLVIPPSVRDELGLDAGDEVEYRVAKLTQEAREEREVRKHFPEFATGDLFHELRGSSVKIAKIYKAYYSVHALKSWTDEGGKGIAGPHEKRMVSGVIFRGDFLRDGFRLVHQELKFDAKLALSSLDAAGRLVLHTADGERLEVRNPSIDFERETDPVSKTEIARVTFRGELP